MNQNIKSLLIKFTKKYKINKNDHFIISDENKVKIFKMLSNENRVDLDVKELEKSNDIEKVAELESTYSDFVTKYTTLGRREKGSLSSDESLSIRSSIIYLKNGDITVQKLTDSQTKIAKNVINKLQEQAQKNTSSPKIKIRNS